MYNLYSLFLAPFIHDFITGHSVLLQIIQLCSTYIIISKGPRDTRTLPQYKIKKIIDTNFSLNATLLEPLLYFDWKLRYSASEIRDTWFDPH